MGFLAPALVVPTRAPLYFSSTSVARLESELRLDLLAVRPDGRTTATPVFMAPPFAARLLKALEQNVALFEERHGAIRVRREPEPTLEGAVIEQVTYANTVLITHTAEEFVFDLRLALNVKGKGPSVLHRLLAVTVPASMHMLMTRLRDAA